MTPDRFEARLKRWLSAHPLKSPPPSQQSRYVDEVMTRIERLEAPVPARSWWRLPLALAASGGFACALLVMWIHASPRASLARIERDWQVLAEVDELDAVPAPSVEEELREVDQLMLAEAQPKASADAEAWIDQALDLLDQAGDDAVLQDEDPDDVLEELEALDRAEMSALPDPTSEGSSFVARRS